MKRALIVLFLIVVGVASSIVTHFNSDTVSFNFYLGSINLPLAVLLIISVILGALIGLLFSLGLALSAQSEKRRLRRKLNLSEREVQNLRDIPIKGRH